ncbi:MAG: GTPase Era [Burkholderiales bacterium]
MVKDSNPPHRAGHVAIVGRPNVGKSTLLNRLVGHKISITSRKPQTTRTRVIGIVSTTNAQLVLVDTPGFQTRHRNALNRMMTRTVAGSVEGVDAVLWVVEALRYDERDQAIRKLLPHGTPVVFAINKIDRIRRKDDLLPFIERLGNECGAAAIVPVSAATGTQTNELLAALAPLLPESQPLFDADEITRNSERFLAAELIREKIFRLTGDELPYAVTVQIESFKVEGGLRRIHAVIIVNKDSHKAMLIGKGGDRLKSIATQARLDMEALFDGRVYLEVWVKVRHGWADDERFLADMQGDA